jgi:hypothetical protein
MLKVKISERLLSDTDKLGYFFAKDRVDTEGIDIENCPTEQVLADFFTNPLQGYLTRRLKAVLIGHAHISTVLETPSATVPGAC